MDIMDIMRRCKLLEIDNYTILNDGYIDVHGDVNLRGRNLRDMPLLFNRVYGDFDCGDNSLTSLNGGPKVVNGIFGCYGNYLYDLKHCPNYVGLDFECDDNRLRTFDGFECVLGRYLYFDQNDISADVIYDLMVNKVMFNHIDYDCDFVTSETLIAKRRYTIEQIVK